MRLGPAARSGAATVALSLLVTLSSCSANHPRQLEATAGSGGVGDGAAARRICDGSPSIRLAFSYATDKARDQAFTSVLDDLGAQFLYVDGTCRYWVQVPSLTAENRDEYYAWRGYRTGLLSREQEDALHSAVDYDDTEGDPLSAACVGQPASDQRLVQLWDGQRVRTCAAMLDVPADWPLRKELYEAGQDFEGPLRVQVGIDAVPDKTTLYSWPLPESPEPFLIEYGSTESIRIEDPDDAAALRALRNTVLAEAENNPLGFSGVIAAEPDGYVRQVEDETYVMSFRDDPPFTNLAGRWAPP